MPRCRWLGGQGLLWLLAASHRSSGFSTVALRHLDGQRSGSVLAGCSRGVEAEPREEGPCALEPCWSARLRQGRGAVAAALACVAVALVPIQVSASPQDLNFELKSRLDLYGKTYSAQRRAQIAEEQKREEEAQSSNAQVRRGLPSPKGKMTVSGRLDERRPPLLSEKERIKVLYAYLEEMERDIFARKWDTLSSYIGVFEKQELAFENIIDSLRTSQAAADRDAKRAMEYEARQMFLTLDAMAEATRFRDIRQAEKSYVQLAIAYDRFLKAADLYDVYDDTDTSKLYESIPEDLLVYDREDPPRVQDDVLIIAGPDKGRTGKLIGVSDASSKGVVRVEYRKRTASKDASFEVKVVDLQNVAKTIPDKPQDAQLKSLMMCPGGLFRGCSGSSADDTSGGE